MIINQLSPEEARRVRAAISGKPEIREPKPKRREGVKATVSQYHSYDPRTDKHVIQLPIVFRTAEYNSDWTPRALKAKWVKEKREMVWSALHAYLPAWRKDRARRSCVTHMEFIRLGIGKLDAKDNLRAAFKPIVDAVCSWLVEGIDVAQHVRGIGHYDDQLEREGVTWNYSQTRCDRNPRAYGIQIVLHSQRPSNDQLQR